MLRKQGLPEDNDDLQNCFQEAVNNISLDAIQRRFLRAYLKDENGEENSSLIPQSLEDWYDDDISSDEDVSSDLNIDSEEIHTDSDL